MFRLSFINKLLVIRIFRDIPALDWIGYNYMSYKVCLPGKYFYILVLDVFGVKSAVYRLHFIPIFITCGWCP